jgi:hypothetical protein
LIIAKFLYLLFYFWGSVAGMEAFLQMLIFINSVRLGKSEQPERLFAKVSVEKRVFVFLVSCRLLVKYKSIAICLLANPTVCVICGVV